MIFLFSFFFFFFGSAWVAVFFGGGAKFRHFSTISEIGTIFGILFYSINLTNFASSSFC
jgi:hypothetical protein